MTEKTMTTYNEIELMEMARDYEALERVALQDAEELRQLRTGERVVIPKSKEHAKFMLIMSMNYLGIKAGEEIHYG